MKGLSFSEPMMIAWLAGRKDVTRRLMNPQPDHETTFFGVLSTATGISFWPCAGDPKDGEDWYSLSERDWKPRYIPGETVYIKETWMTATPDDGESFGILYRATLSKPWTDVQWKQSFKLDNRAEKYFNGKDVWHSPRFMPEWASRSKARIVSVRPERIQEITEEEIRREGISVFSAMYYDEEGNKDFDPDEYRFHFRSLWNSLHGKWQGIYVRVEGKKKLVGFECFPFDEADIPPVTEKMKKSGLPYTAYPNPWVWRIELERVTP